MLKSKGLTLLIAIVFAFTVIFPVGAAFASEDNVSISGSYNYVKADDDTPAGIIRVKEDGMETGTINISIQLSLPDDVEFSSSSGAEDNFGNWIDTSTSTADSVYVEGVGSSYFELRLNGIGGASDVEFAEFDFSDAVSLLDIDDDFTGNLEVAVDVIGMGIENSKETILWTDNDEVTIAKVAGGDVDIVVGDAKKVSVGGDKEVADITLEESMAGAFSDNETITLEIEAEGVEFKTLDPDPSRLGVIDLGRSADEGEYIYYKVQITEPSQSLPGQLKFDEIMLDIAPDATGEIEISVTSDGDADLDETVTVGAVGGGDLTVTVDEDTGMEEYMRKASLDELWEITIETNGELSEGDKVYITLPDNFEFYEKALQLFDMMSDISKEVDYMNTFDGHQSVWLEVNANGDGEDEITVSNLWVAALPECQYGDIVVEIGGEIGQASAKVGFVKPAVTVKPEQTHISRGNNQLAGNITFTETDVDAVEDDMKLHIVLPNGVEFASTPTVTVNGEEIDGARIGPGKYDDDVCELTLDKARGSKIDTLVLSGIRYDIEHWFNPGEVIMVSLGGNDAEAGDNFNLLYESFMLGFFESLVKAGLESPNPAVAWNNYQFKEHADEKVLEVPNAIIIDPNEVTTSFAVGDEGVYVENGRTLVQVNLLSETLGLQKSWDADAKTAYFVKNGKVVAFPVGQNIINVNKAEITVDQGAKIINGFTCVTLRGLEMAFGGKLTWDNETKTAIFVFNK